MTRDSNHLASLTVPEASVSSNSNTATPTILTPPSDNSTQLSNSPIIPSRPRRPSPPLDEPRPLSAFGKKHPGHEDDEDETATHRGGIRWSEDWDGKSDSDAESTEDLDSDNMAGRPPLHRPTDGRSQTPLLKEERGRPSYDGPARPSPTTRRSTLRSRSPEFDSASATKRKYTYAGFFLVLSLISFTVQTETASYVSKGLGWNKAYCMLYLTHGSWSLLWPTQLLILRLQRRKTPWKAFWRRHTYILRTTAQMVQSQDLHLTSRDSHRSPIPYILRTTAFVASALTIAGGSWYVAVNMTSSSDLTAIYNCSAFFAYAFSIPLLKDKFRFDKVFSVAVAIAGVLIVAYGDSGDGSEESGDPEKRFLGNIIIGVGSVLYGLYEVLYKKLACPPEGTSPGRVFSGSFLVLISLTSPVLSSVAALLTIFLVAIVEWLLPNDQGLSTAAIIGGLLIIAAFLLLSWSTYREMDEEHRKRLENEIAESDSDE
ncbi:hypothetical protein MMC20_005722 [Loxospora ochrophaea]|nr:hypothetical protein [Loxospora ochrophaea]